MSHDRPLKVLFAWWGNTDALRARYERIVAAAPPSLDITMARISLPDPDAKVPWPDLDRRYHRNDRQLLKLYEQVRAAADDRDVLLHYNSWNLHPEFLRSLPTFNAYCAWDDPESSEKLTQPIAPACEAAFYGNVASLPQYRSWGCPRVAHLPIFVDPGAVPPRHEQHRILNADRDNDIILCCGRTRWRQQRVHALCAAFPQARLFGRGWGTGYIPQQELEALYRRSKIGWNVHNSTGPINERLFALAAWGIMPLCDNRTGLAQLFDLDSEAVGFDTIPQAIDRTRYYLEHDDERATIAAAAYRRYWRDYDAAANWRRIENHLRAWLAEPGWRHARRPPVPTTSLKTASFAGRWGRKIITRYERLRFGLASRDLDERFYVGPDVPYDPRGKVTSAAAARGRAPVGRIDDADHRLTLVWALVSMIGDARRVIALGPGSDDLVRLAERQPGRRVAVVDDAAQISSADTADVLVVTDATAALADRLSDARPPVTRIVLVHHPPAGPSTKATREFAKTVTRIGDDLRLFFLADPLVPWLTALEGPAAVCPVIASVHLPPAPPASRA